MDRTAKNNDDGSRLLAIPLHWTMANDILVREASQPCDVEMEGQISARGSGGAG